MSGRIPVLFHTGRIQTDIVDELDLFVRPAFFQQYERVDPAAEVYASTVLNQTIVVTRELDFGISRTEPIKFAFAYSDQPIIGHSALNLTLSFPSLFGAHAQRSQRSRILIPTFGVVAFVADAVPPTS